MSGKTRWMAKAVQMGQIAWQGGLLVAAFLAADAAVRHFALPVSGGVLGLFAVVALLLTGWLPVGAIKRGADWLLAEMLLFFVPAVVAVVKYIGLLRHEGVQLVAVIVLGTMTVMIATAVTVDWAWRAECYLMRRRLAVRRCAVDTADGRKARV